MCVICAAIPVTAAVGAKLNADQNQRKESRRLPVSKVTAIVIGLLIVGSSIYHSLRWEN